MFDALSAEFDSFIDMFEQRWTELMFSNERDGKLVVIVSLVKENAVSSVVIDLYFDDGLMRGELPMSGPRWLFLF